jgi:hypothetical protein
MIVSYDVERDGISLVVSKACNGNDFTRVCAASIYSFCIYYQNVCGSI